MRSTTDSFILELKLHTNKSDERFLSRCFFHAANIHNSLVKHCRKQIVKLKRDPEYKKLLSEYVSYPEKSKERKEIGKELSSIVSCYGLTEYSLHEYVKAKQAPVSKFIGSMVAQKIASDVWRSVESYLYKDGSKIYFLKFNDIKSFEGKNNTSNLIYRNNTLKIGKRKISVSPAKTDYEKESLTHRVKYCRVVRKAFDNRFHYYLQLVLEGDPPIKHTIGSGAAGLDIGTSTVAFVSDESCKLTLLGDQLDSIEKEKARVQRAMDRSRRTMNSGKYNSDGTFKKGNRGKWVVSNHYRRLRMKHKTLCRKYAAALKQEQNILANELCKEANQIYVEKMNFKSLQKRSRETKKSRSGKIKSKKRFGHSLQVRAPAQFLSILAGKLARSGGELIKINTVTFKASQYDHITDTYTKKKLAKRYNTILGKWIQRDLYSAFLLRNSDTDLKHTNRESCIIDYPSFLEKHDTCIERIKTSGNHIPKSFGIVSDF